MNELKILNNDNSEKKIETPNSGKKKKKNDFNRQLISLSPKKVRYKKKFTNNFKRTNSISAEDNKNIKKMKRMSIFNVSKNVDLHSVKYLDKKNKKFMEILNIISKSNKYRDKNEKEAVINFLNNNKIREEITDDLEYFHLNIRKYLNYILEDISLQEFSYLDIIYYDKDIPNNFYYILNDTNVGEYDLNITEELIDFENYFLYLYELNDLYEKYNEKKVFSQKININDSNEDNYFIDSYLIRKIIDENNKIYNILSYNDIKDVKEIIIKTKLYNFIEKIEKAEVNTFNKEENIDEKEIDEEKEEEKLYNTYHEEIMKIHNDYNADLNIINYDIVINKETSYKKYLSFFKESISSDPTILHYIKLLNNPGKNSIKKIKYKKIKNHKKFEYFGNFSSTSCLSYYKNFTTRKFITKSETNSTLVLCFNKSEYFHKISNILKEEKEKNIIFFHDEYIFKDVNMEYFAKKIFPDFKLNFNTKGDKIFTQNEQSKNLIILKEGIIELQMQNTSLSELSQKINYIKDLLLRIIKEDKNNSNKLIEQISKLEMDNKTDLQMNLVKELINKKLNIVFSRCSRGFFGEYECFYNIPSLLTGIVVSENSEEYFYSYQKYNHLNSYTLSLNERFEEYSFNKLYNLLKRMFNIYNSYWKILNKQYSYANLLKEENEEDNNKINNNIKYDIEFANNSDNINNINKQDNFTNENINRNLKISQSQDIKKFKLFNPLTKTIFGNKFKEIINNNFEPISNDGLVNKNKANQIKEKEEKKSKIKQWDFNIYQSKINSLHSDRLKMKNLEKMNLIKKNKIDNYKKKPKDASKPSVKTNNNLKNKIFKQKNAKKIDKNILKNIFLPPILNTNTIEKNDDNNTFRSTLKSHIFKKTINFENFMNKNTVSKSERKKYTINHDIKKVSINFLKTRKTKYFMNLDDSDEYECSWGEEYYYSNQ